MKKIIKKIQQWRDEKFRQRIDRVYFRKDKHGFKRMEGGILLDGFIYTSGSVITYGVVPAETDQDGLALLKEDSDKQQKPCLEFDDVSESLCCQGILGKIVRYKG